MTARHTNTTPSYVMILSGKTPVSEDRIQNQHALDRTNRINYHKSIGQPQPRAAHTIIRLKQHRGRQTFGPTNHDNIDNPECRWYSLGLLLAPTLFSFLIEPLDVTVRYPGHLEVTPQLTY